MKTHFTITTIIGTRDIKHPESRPPHTPAHNPIAHRLRNVLNKRFQRKNGLTSVYTPNNVIIYEPYPVAKHYYQAELERPARTLLNKHSNHKPVDVTKLTFRFQLHRK